MALRYKTCEGVPSEFTGGAAVRQMKFENADQRRIGRSGTSRETGLVNGKVRTSKSDQKHKASAQPAGERMLLYSPSTDGGICEYMHAQANELARRGYRVDMLAAPAFLARHPERIYRGRGALLSVSAAFRGRWLRRLLHAAVAVANPCILAAYAIWSRPRLVLLDSMTEHFAPLWAWPHWLIARSGRTTYAATLHDPVRQRLGPAWWHALSLRTGYAPLSIGLVHDLDAAASAGVPGHVRLVEVPHGIFPVARGTSPPDVRADLAIPAAAPVALSFGFVSDRKNLDLAIEALPRLPDLHLIVAGRRGSSQDRPVAEYRRQAERLGVAGRCHFIERYVALEELDALFAASDILLLCYSKSFVSQSGVLHVAANWGLPVLASGGEGPLLKAVRKYGLGLIVAPDSAAALAEGLDTLVRQRAKGLPECAGWQAFRSDASWSRNIDLLLAALGQQAA